MPNQMMIYIELLSNLIYIFHLIKELSHALLMGKLDQVKHLQWRDQMNQLLGIYLCLLRLNILIKNQYFICLFLRYMEESYLIYSIIEINYKYWKMGIRRYRYMGWKRNGWRMREIWYQWLNLLTQRELLIAQHLMILPQGHMLFAKFILKREAIS